MESPKSEEIRLCINDRNHILNVPNFITTTTNSIIATEIQKYNYNDHLII